MRDPVPRPHTRFPHVFSQSPPAPSPQPKSHAMARSTSAHAAHLAILADRKERNRQSALRYVTHALAGVAAGCPPPLQLECSSVGRKWRWALGVALSRRRCRCCERVHPRPRVSPPPTALMLQTGCVRAWWDVCGGLTCAVTLERLSCVGVSVLVTQVAQASRRGRGGGPGAKRGAAAGDNRASGKGATTGGVSARGCNRRRGWSLCWCCGMFGTFLCVLTRAIPVCRITVDRPGFWVPRRQSPFRFQGRPRRRNDATPVGRRRQGRRHCAATSCGGSAPPPPASATRRQRPTLTTASSTTVGHLGLLPHARHAARRPDGTTPTTTVCTAFTLVGVARAADGEGCGPPLLQGADALACWRVYRWLFPWAGHSG